ncbi:MFS transporter [Chelativorans sp. ZYF759]|uniref:MFS transporter n=1 Tax=Chelativorans sp. ZYF759 TaxID=2692213 RepID=UPI00145E0AF8|nr:MFS transporter [Chelativorans sp. ZYF759]NMG38309.1 MFS transporter [Chelativorans sp. ZYF759]
MLSVLSNRTYRHLFAAQVLSLIGTGLTTVALGLLAYELAGADAGQVLGIALAIKMIAYVGVSPFAGALAGLLPRRGLLVGLDVVRAGMVLLLPFVTEVWQIYVLVFLFQSCSAAFTPTFQATIPDILPVEEEYTTALSLSRLAYDLESLLSPLLAALALTVIGFHWLFVGNAIGFLASGLLVLSVGLPMAKSVQRPFMERLTRGSWIYFATPRLRGLLALSFAAAASGAMVIVNTVVIVRAGFGGSEGDVAWFFAAYGAGSMAVALALPMLLQGGSPRGVMIGGAAILPVLLLVAAIHPTWWTIISVWALLGAGASAIMTPAGILLRRSAHPEDRPSLFAAQFALSHAGWLVTYPLAGWLGGNVGMTAAFLVMGAGAAAGAVAAMILWPSHDPGIIEHTHEEIEHSHPLEAGADHAPPIAARNGVSHRHAAIRHAHPFVIDDHHPVWPRP